MVETVKPSGPVEKLIWSVGVRDWNGKCVASAYRKFEPGETTAVREKWLAKVFATLQETYPRKEFRYFVVKK